MTQHADGADSNNQHRCGACCKRKRPREPRLVAEPKTYFANERTFFHWISPGALLLVGSFFLTSGEGNENLAIAVMLLSSFLILYALFIYFKRIHLIKTRATAGYHERFGPIAIASLLIAGGLAHVITKQQSAPLLGALQGSPSEACNEWPLRMENGLAFQTNYRLTFPHANSVYMNSDGDRLIVREALDSLRVVGASFVASGESAWQHRTRVLVGSEHDLPQLQLVQDLGEAGNVVWVGTDSPQLPCGMGARVEYEVGCNRKQVVAIARGPIPGDSVWVGGVDLRRAFSSMQRSLSVFGFISPAAAIGMSVIRFDGLFIADQAVAVTLSSSSDSAVVSFSVPGNNASSHALQSIAHSVWQQLAHRLLDEEAMEACLQ